MKLGLNLVMVRPEHMPGIAARAEQLGYESVFVPDHVVFPARFDSAYPYTEDGSFPFPADTPLFDPWILLSGIAAATTTIKLGTAVYILPLRHPFVTARTVGTLDVVSGGRAILGAGIGWLAGEFAAMGESFRARLSRTEECVQVIRALWTEAEPEFHGRHFDFDAVRFEPKPMSSPHPPIVLGGGAEGALDRAARLGDGWMSTGVTTFEETRRQVERVRALRAEHGVPGRSRSPCSRCGRRSTTSSAWRASASIAW